MEIMKEEYMKEKLLKQINKLPRKTKKDLKEHVEKGRTIQKAENKTLFNKMEGEIAGDIKARKDKLEKLYQERKLSEKLNKNFDTPKIDAKSVILSIKLLLTYPQKRIINTLPIKIENKNLRLLTLAIPQIILTKKAGVNGKEITNTKLENDIF